MYGWDPQTIGAKPCANQDEGACRADQNDAGGATMYFGSGLTFMTKHMNKGEIIDCNTAAFNCEPLWGTNKHCLIKQKLMCAQSWCCEGQWDIDMTGPWREQGSAREVLEGAVFANCNDARAAVRKMMIDLTSSPEREEVSQSKWDDIRDKVFDQACKPCYGSTPNFESAHSVNMSYLDEMVPITDPMADIPSDGTFTMPSLYQVDLYLVPLLAFIVLILSCVQCWMTMKRCGRCKSKRYGVAKTVDYDSEMGLDEADPMK